MLPATVPTRVHLVPDPEANTAYHGALDLLADALAERFIAAARAQVAAELGVSVEHIDHERDQPSEPSPFELTAMGRAS